VFHRSRDCAHHADDFQAVLTITSRLLAVQNAIDKMQTLFFQWFGKPDIRADDVTVADREMFTENARYRLGRDEPFF